MGNQGQQVEGGATPTERRKTRRRPVKPNLRGHQSREAILDVAEKHFGDFGFRGASIATIAEEVGLSDPGLLHHFGSKAGLLTKLLEQRFAVDEVKLHENEALGIRGLFDALQDIASENVGRMVGVKLLMVLLAESVTDDHPARSYFEERYEHVRRIMVQHLTAAKERGEMRADIDPHHLATGLIAMLDGLQLQWLLQPKLDLDGIARTMLHLIEPAVTTR